MKKHLLFSIFAAFAVLSCGSDDMPCLYCDAYCLYYSYSSRYYCDRMSVLGCYERGGEVYDNDRTCGKDSSSSGKSSSSTMPEYEYCVFVSDRVCTTGPINSCPSGGTLSNSCPYGSSSLVTYTVTYSANSGSGAPAAQTKTHDVSLTLSSVQPTRTGYTFAGWNTAAGGGGTAYAVGASYTANASVTLYAQWNIICTLNGGTVTIGEQVWMKENLNCNVNGSKCQINQESNCDTYGRLYNWATAMNLPASCNSSYCSSQINAKHQGICPSGWHIPNDADWNVLMKFVNPSCSDYSDCAGAGTKLKSSNLWISYSGDPKGTDEYGFSALPGGYGDSVGSFGDVGIDGLWWSATESNANYAFYRGMYYNYEYVDRYDYYKNNLFSVRCLQD